MFPIAHCRKFGMTYMRDKSRMQTVSPMKSCAEMIEDKDSDDVTLHQMLDHYINDLEKSDSNPRKRPATDDILAKLAKPEKKSKKLAKETSSKEMDKLTEPDEDKDEKPLSTKYPGLDTKTSPSKVLALFKTLKNKPHEDKEAYFRDTSLGHLLDLNVGRLPSQLAYYVLKSYDHRTQTITLKDGKSFRVCAENVHMTLGLPMRNVSMLKTPTSVTVQDILDMKAKFAKQFGKIKGELVKMSELKSLILKEEVGPDFIRNLVLYINTALICCNGNDNVVLDILPHLQDVDKIHELNWCEYVMHKLSNSTGKFRKRNAKAYYGPILFLIVSKHIHTLFLLINL